MLLKLLKEVFSIDISITSLFYEVKKKKPAWFRTRGMSLFILVTTQLYIILEIILLIVTVLSMWWIWNKVKDENGN